MRTPVTILLLMMAIALLAQNPVIAHRGYWKADGAAQNSIAALKAAQKLRVYGSEFDVWITADGVAVVHHDAHIDGDTIEKAMYADLKDFRLSNGEPLPTLAAYLKTGAKRKSVKLILEIKPHSQSSREDAVVKEVLRLVDKSRVAKQVEYISFSRHICDLLHQLRPKAKVAYLSGDLTPDQVKAHGWTGIDYNQAVLRRNPDWTTEAHAAGLSTNVWTVNNEQDMRQFLQAGVQYITTDEPALLMSIAREP